MAINSTHPAYDKYSQRWTRCRDAAEGEEAVKTAGTLYLPKLGGMESADYDAYKKRAMWYGATSRTIEGLRGAIFRKDPVVQVPTAVEPMLDQVTDDNLDFISLASEVVTQQLTVGRQGLLVDLPKQVGADPYISRYKAENILNWRTETQNGRERLTLVVLKEEFEKNGADEFELEMKVRYRVLRLEDGLYVQELWDEKQAIERMEPKRLGSRLDFIPFRFVNSTTLTSMPEKPPLVDVVDVNLSHYRTSADLEHGAHFTALPTPWLAGFPMDRKFSIGGGVAFVTDNTSARAGMLEFTGKGLDTLIQLKTDKEGLMAVLGARLLEEQRAGVEAAETVRLRGSGESGALSTVARTASRGLEDVLGWLTWWKGAVTVPDAPDVVSVSLNTDFMDERLDPQTITALLQALQSGALTKRTWLYNLERGELLPPETDLDEEIDVLDVESGAPEDEPVMLTAVESNAL